jgi:hypothetical protein
MVTRMGVGMAKDKRSKAASLDAFFILSVVGESQDQTVILPR